LVSVIMTTANTSAYLHTAVDSILSQTHKNLELIIVDDSSTDGTFEEALALAASDPRVRPIHSMQAAGTYVAKNLGLTLARGDFVAFQDSDDWSKPDRLAKQVSLLQETPTAVASTCNYERHDERGALVLNRGKAARRGPISLVFRKDVVLCRLGFFDSVRTSADEEFRERMLLVFGLSAIVHVDESLYLARARAGSLTTDGPAPLNLGAPIDTGSIAFLSPLRRQYFEAYRVWHRSLAAGTDQPQMPFPLAIRLFPAPAALLPSPVSATQQPVHAAVASVPGRQAQLAAVVAAIAPQVDVLHVYLNGYATVPDFLQGNPAIRVARSQEWGDVRDNGKFFFLNEAGSYYITLDDDLAYPADYVRTLLLNIEKYGRQAVVGVHGVLLADPLTQFYANRTVLHFTHALEADRSVHLLGTGTVAFHRDTLALTYSDFGEPGMADLWFAIAAKRQGVPLRCIGRGDRWVSLQTASDQPSLFKEFTRATEASTAIQTAVAKSCGPWDAAALRSSTAPLANDLLNRFSHGALASRGVNAGELRELAWSSHESAGPVKEKVG
jgi:hypothetical protein